MPDQNNHVKHNFDISEFQQKENSHEASLYNAAPDNDATFQPLDESQEALIPLHHISLEAVIKSLIEKGILSHQELSEHESASKKAFLSIESPEITTEQMMDKTPEPHFVRTYSRRKKKPVKHKFLRKVLSRHKWGRRIGTLFFGWKWSRKGTNEGDGILMG